MKFRLTAALLSCALLLSGCGKGRDSGPSSDFTENGSGISQTAEPETTAGTESASGTTRSAETARTTASGTQTASDSGTAGTSSAQSAGSSAAVT